MLVIDLGRFGIINIDVPGVSGDVDASGGDVGVGDGGVNVGDDGVTVDFPGVNIDAGSNSVIIDTPGFSANFGGAGSPNGRTVADLFTGNLNFGGGGFINYSPDGVEISFPGFNALF